MYFVIMNSTLVIIILLREIKMLFLYNILEILIFTDKESTPKKGKLDKDSPAASEDRDGEEKGSSNKPIHPAVRTYYCYDEY